MNKTDYERETYEADLLTHTESYAVEDGKGFCKHCGCVVDLAMDECADFVPFCKHCDGETTEEMWED